MKTRTSPFRTVVLTGLIAGIAVVCCYSGLRAKSAPPTNDLAARLAEASQRMREKGNLNFVVVEAFRDSLITAGKPFVIRYLDGAITINGVQLSEPQLSRYRTMLLPTNDTVSKHANSVSLWSVESDSLSVEELLNPQSFYRNRPSPVGSSVSVYSYVHKTPEKADKIKAGTSKMTNPVSVSTDPMEKDMMEDLLSDGLIVPGKPIFMRKDKYGLLYVNGQEIKGAFKEKYDKLVVVDAPKSPPGQSHPAIVTVYPDGVMSPNSTSSRPRQADVKGYTYASADPAAATNVDEHVQLTALLVGDGLADPVKSINLRYTNKGIFVNNKKLEGPLETKYLQLMTDIFKYPKPKKEDDMVDMTF